MRQSPIRYMGNKNKLIKKGLCSLFPSNIGVFYDMFGGSGVVSLNTQADKYVLNELDSYIYGVYRLFLSDPDNIIDDINKRIDIFDLPRFSTDNRRKGITKEIRGFYKDNFMKARTYLNQNLGAIDILTLMYYSMSTTIRINPNTGQYNMPFGNGYFIEDKHGKQIRGFTKWLQDKNVTLYNLDYQELLMKPTIYDFVYFDPPYLNSTATYNESGCWDKKSQDQLLYHCDMLNAKGIAFGLSNTFKNKGVENKELYDWAIKNNYHIYYFDGFDYCTFGTGRSETVEVYISNYHTNQHVCVK